MGFATLLANPVEIVQFECYCGCLVSVGANEGDLISHQLRERTYKFPLAWSPWAQVKCERPWSLSGCVPCS